MIRYPCKDFRMHFVRDPGRPSEIRDRHFHSLERTWEFPERLLLWSKEHQPSQYQRGDATARQVINVTLEVRRNPGYYVNNLVIPMFMIVTMSGSSFFIPPENIQDRLAASLTLVLAAVAYKYNVVQTVPPIGYHTWLDGYVLMSYGFLFLVVVENCGAYLLVRKYGYDSKDSYSWESYIVIPLSICFLVLNLGFAVYASCARRWPSRLAQKKLEKKRKNELPLVNIPGVISPRSFCSHASDESVWGRTFFDEKTLPGLVVGSDLSRPIGVKQHETQQRNLWN